MSCSVAEEVSQDFHLIAIVLSCMQTCLCLRLLQLGLPNRYAVLHQRCVPLAIFLRRLQIVIARVFAPCPERISLLFRRRMKDVIHMRLR